MLVFLSVSAAAALPDLEVPVGYPFLAAGDLNGDGWVDLVGETFFVGERHVAYGDGAGGFDAPVPHVTADYAAGIADIDGDGYDDLFTAMAPNELEVTVYRGGPAGLAPEPAWAFELPYTWTGTRRFAAIGDVDGDGYVDVTIGLKVVNGSAAGPVPSVELAGNLAAEGAEVHPVGDIDGDGLSDLVVPDHPWDYFEGTGGGCRIYLGSPTGPVEYGYVAFANDVQAGAVALGADVDGDGDRELILGNAVRESYDMYLYDGTFTVYDGAGPAIETESRLEARTYFIALASLGDPDGDGDEDLVFAHDKRINRMDYDPVTGIGGIVSTFGTYEYWVALPMMTIDVDNDGLMDVIGTSYSANGAAIWFGTADPVVTDPPTTSATGDTGDTGSDDTSATPTDGTDGSSGDGAGSSNADPSGCGCGTAPRSVALGALAALAFGIRRRRRDAPRG